MSNCKSLILSEFVLVRPTRPTLNLRLLIHPFGNECDVSGFQLLSNDEYKHKCSSLTSLSKSCKQGEIFDWSKQVCESFCPSPYIWSNSGCVLDQQVFRPPVPTVCEEADQSTMVSLYKEGVSEQNYTDSGIVLSVGNGSKYCLECDWITLEEDKVTIDKDLNLHLGGELYEMPLYYRDSTGTQYKVCAEAVNGSKIFNQTYEAACADTPEISHDSLVQKYGPSSTVTVLTDGIKLSSNSTNFCSKCDWARVPQTSVHTISNQSVSLDINGERLNVEYPLFLAYEGGSHVDVCTGNASSAGILGAICKGLGETSVSIVTTTLSMVCLLTMIVIYSVISNLRNTPGLIVLSQV